MRVTVLGAAASHAAAGQACAGHLVEGGGARVLLDCGNGVVANAYRVLDPLTIDAVVVTHGHPDHYADIYSLQAMVRYAPDGPRPPLELHAPPGLFERMQALLSDRGSVEFREAFRVTDLVHQQTFYVGGMAITPLLVDHTDPTFAVRVEADGSRLVYTADTAPGQAARAAAEGADLLLAEATLPERYRGMAPHLSAREAGELAREAGAGALVLVHLWPTNDRGEALREAAQAFGGPVSVASELDVYEVVARGAGR